MVKKFFLLVFLMFSLFSCFFDTKLQDLTMSRTPYTGDELRIDGILLFK